MGATCGTIVSGAMAERTQLKGFVIFTTIMTSFIYPVVVYWGWSGAGLLANSDGNSIFGPGLSDFAGSGIVRLTGAVGALAGIVVVGARKDRWEKEEEFAAHNVPFVVLGTLFLWFGWYGFNPGSTLQMHTTDNAYQAGLVACNTTLAPCVAGLVVFALRAHVCAPKSLDVGGFCNGILAGLVSITAGCGSVQPWEAIVIGFIGGFVYQGASILLRNFGLDDVVDAVPVHGACGVWGLLALGIFGGPKSGGNGILWGGDQLGTLIVAALLIILWVGLLSTAIFLPLQKLGMLRLDDETQDKGADILEHSPNKANSNEAEEPAAVNV